MSKKTIILIIIAVVLIIGLGVGGYLRWNNWKKSKTEIQALEKTGEAAEKIIESTTQGIWPSLGVNPLESKPDINPADKANPFKNIKINPFE